jgi:hypothetical protein
MTNVVWANAPHPQQSTEAADYTIGQTGQGFTARNKNGSSFTDSDAATVIQAAISALGTSGGKVHIKAGIYPLHSTIRLPENTSQEKAFIIEGDGSNTYLKPDHNHTNIVFYLGDGTNETIFNYQFLNLMIRCDPLSDRVAYSDCFYAAGGVARSLWWKVEIAGTADAAIDAGVIIQCDIRQCIFGAAGRQVTGELSYSWIDDCYFDGGGLWQIDSTKYGYGPTWITNNILVHSPRQAMRLGGYGWVVMGNTIDDASWGNGGTYPAITLAAVNYATIAHNRIADLQGAGATALYGIQETGSCSYNTIADNQIANLQGAPAIVYTSTTDLIHDNIGYNPLAKSAVALPGTGVAFPLLPYNAVYVVTTTTGLTGLTLDGTAVSYAAGIPIYVSANKALIPTYSGSPVFELIPI